MVEERRQGPEAGGPALPGWGGAFAVTTPSSAAASSPRAEGGGGSRGQNSQRSGVGSPALAMEGEPTPDFSVLRDLLAPPCLEPELQGVLALPRSSCAGSLILRRENKGPAESRCRRAQTFPPPPRTPLWDREDGPSSPSIRDPWGHSGDVRWVLEAGSARGHSLGLIPLPARPRTPWLALPAAVTGLRFLQETAELLPQAPVPEAPRAEPWLEPPLPPRTLAPVPVPGGPRAWDAADSLALISLQCHRLSPPRTRKQVGLGVGLGRGPGLQALAGRTLRKQPHPQRGAEGQEPGFQGVVLRMHLKPAQEGHQLLITAQFSSACGSRSWGASASPAEALPNPVGASTSNHQDSPGSRCCASCRTQRTPLWRDAEDGTPLCNACGIRYKKYGIRCPACWTVPRKSICPLGHCTRCGAWLCTPQGPLGKGEELHAPPPRPCPAAGPPWWAHPLLSLHPLPQPHIQRNLSWRGLWVRVHGTGRAGRTLYLPDLWFFFPSPFAPKGLKAMIPVSGLGCPASMGRKKRASPETLQ
ncbi:GATA-type zinc finger protein 1 [Sarcophilus harrisii]